MPKPGAVSSVSLRKQGAFLVILEEAAMLVCAIIPGKNGVGGEDNKNDRDVVAP